MSNQATIITTGSGRKLNVLGHGVNVLLGMPETQGASFVFETITPPGLAVPPHRHQHEDEYGYVIEGNFEVFLDGQNFAAQAGSVIYCPRHSTHGFRNSGSTPGRMLWVSTPGAAVERFFNDLGALPADAPPDMAKVLGIFAHYDIEVAPPPAA